MTNKKRGMSKPALLAIVCAVLLAGGLAYKFTSAPEEPKVKLPSERAQAPGEMTDEERQEYVKTNVSHHDIELGVDTKPGSDEPVPGLLLVTGEIKNNGDRTLKRLNMNILMEDGKGEVFSSFVENVLRKKGPLAGGKSRKVRFHVPDKKEYKGKFRVLLR